MREDTYEKRLAIYKSISAAATTQAISEERKRTYLINKKIQDALPESIRNDQQRNNLKKIHYAKLHYIKELYNYADELVQLIKNDLCIDEENCAPDYATILQVFKYYQTNIDTLKTETDSELLKGFFSLLKPSPYVKLFKKCLEDCPNTIVAFPEELISKTKVIFKNLSKENIEILFEKLIALDMQNNASFKKLNSGLHTALCQYILEIENEIRI